MDTPTPQAFWMAQGARACYEAYNRLRAEHGLPPWPFPDSLRTPSDPSSQSAPEQPDSPEE